MRETFRGFEEKSGTFPRRERVGPATIEATPIPGLRGKAVYSTAPISRQIAITRSTRPARLPNRTRTDSIRQEATGELYDQVSMPEVIFDLSSPSKAIKNHRKPRVAQEARRRDSSSGRRGRIVGPSGRCHDELLRNIARRPRARTGGRYLRRRATGSPCSSGNTSSREP